MISIDFDKLEYVCKGPGACNKLQNIIARNNINIFYQFVNGYGLM